MNHEKYMRRALQLARNGLLYAHPNPMVGAVIVDDQGRIIGEGYHRRCGEGHAEVNAIASVRNKGQLKNSTIYVTLEPCAHYGRTGPCSKLIIDSGIPRVVVGCRDPFDKVDGKGIEMMRQAGIDVTVGVLEHECRCLNAIFYTAHTLHRPFVILKWAQTADGFIDIARDKDIPAARISTPVTSALTHQLRAVVDGILVGSQTVIDDNPGLDNRLWPGPSPIPIILDRRGRIDSGYRVMSRNPIVVGEDIPMDQVLALLYQQGITSILVEGGRRVLNSFIKAGIWDLARVEISPLMFGERGGTHAPDPIEMPVIKTSEIEGQIVKYYSKNDLVDVKNL